MMSVPLAMVDRTEFFKGEKPVLITVHPSRPLVCVIMKHRHVVVVFNYVEQTEVMRFSLEGRLEDKRDLEVSRHSTARDSVAADRAKVGEPRSLWFYDQSVVSHVCPHGSIDHRIVMGNWLIVGCEHKVLMVCLDNSSVLEANSSQFDSKVLTCVAPVYVAPVVVAGAADGNIRLWHYDTCMVNPVKLPVSGKPVTALTIAVSHGGSTTWAVAGAENGTLASYDVRSLSTGRGDASMVWNSQKLHDGALVDIVYDEPSQQLFTLSAAGTLIVLQAPTGQVQTKVRVGRKQNVPRQLLPCTTADGVTDCFLLPTRFEKVMSIAPDFSSRSLTDLVDLPCTKKGVAIKIYSVAVHPTIPSMVFCCTNAGCHYMVLAPVSGMPLATVAYTPDEEAPFAQTAFVTPRDKVLTIQRTVFYIRQATLYQRNVEGVEGTTDEVLGQEKGTGRSQTGSSAAISVAASPSGNYLAVVCAQGIEIRSVATRQVLNDNVVPGVSVVWHGGRDTFATFHNDTISIYDVLAPQQKVQQVATNVGIMPPRGICGGRWLGVLYQNEHFQFYQWDGEGTVGGMLAQPTHVVWDRNCERCALVYPASTAIMQCSKRAFRLLCLVHLNIRHAMWWNHALLADTGTDVYCVFPESGNYEAVLLCSSEVTPHVTHAGSAGGLEDTMLSSPSGSGGAPRESRFPSSFSSRGSSVSVSDLPPSGASSSRHGGLRSGFDGLHFMRRSHRGDDDAQSMRSDTRELGKETPPTIDVLVGWRPAVPSRPQGLLTFVEVVGGSLYVMDHTRRVSGIPLDIPVLKWKWLAQAGCQGGCSIWMAQGGLSANQVVDFVAPRSGMDAVTQLGVTDLDGTHARIKAHLAAGSWESVVTELKSLQGEVSTSVLYDLLSMTALACAQAAPEAACAAVEAVANIDGTPVV